MFIYTNGQTLPLGPSVVEAGERLKIWKAFFLILSSAHDSLTYAVGGDKCEPLWNGEKLCSMKMFFFFSSFYSELRRREEANNR